MADLGRTAGTQTQIITSGTTITDGSFGSASSQVDNTTNEHWYADFVLHINPGTAPDANGPLELHLALEDIQSTNDGPVPDANFSQVIAVFEADNATGNQYLYLYSVRIPTEKFKVLIKNESGQSTGTYNLYITTWTPAS